MVTDIDAGIRITNRTGKSQYFNTDWDMETKGFEIHGKDATTGALVILSFDYLANHQPLLVIPAGTDVIVPKEIARSAIQSQPSTN